MNSYFSLKDMSVAEIEIKKSRFIAQAFPVKTEDEAIELIRRVKKDNPQARHNVYAFSVRENNVKRFSDDGEPSGTGGKPILDIIEHMELQDILIVVTRYFGGILLGTGGLQRAYGGAAKEAVENGTIIEMSASVVAQMSFDYSYYQSLLKILDNYTHSIIDSEFSNEVNLTFAVKIEDYQKIREKVVDLTNGRVNIKKEEEKIYFFEKQ